MKKLAIVLMFVSTFGFSQDKITKNLGDFHELKTYRGLNIELIQSESPKIVIEGDKADQVTIKNSNGVLKISLKVISSFSSKDVKVFIYFSKKIDGIVANEGSVITSDRIIKQDKISLKVEEAGKIELEIGATDIVVKSYTGGNITLTGYAEKQDVKVNSGGDYNGENLKTDTAEVSASSGSNATVNVSKAVDANATLGGTITVTGDPTNITKKESLGGYVRH